MQMSASCKIGAPVWVPQVESCIYQNFHYTTYEFPCYFALVLDNIIGHVLAGNGQNLSDPNKTPQSISQSKRRKQKLDVSITPLEVLVESY